MNNDEQGQRKRTRAANGRSTPYEGADGRWHAYVTMGTRPDGSLDRRHVTGKNQSAVTKKVVELEQQRAAGNVAKAGKKPTVEAWLRTWLETNVEPKCAPRTADDYWSKCRNHVFPHIGKISIDKLTPEHLESLYAKLAKSGLAATTVLKVHRIISRALKIAERRRIVSRNVATLLDAPTIVEAEIEALTGDEARAILAVSSGRRNGARWSVALALGLRQGEALGLRWSFLDLEAGVMRVHWQLQWRKWKHGCADVTRCCARGCTDARACAHAPLCPRRHSGGFVFCEPKAKSKRTVPIPSALIRVLKAHRTAQLKERMQAGAEWTELDLVFATATGGPIYRKEDSAEWKRILKLAEVHDARVHDGRHTAGTLLAEQGVDIRVIAELLGHAQISTTKRYANPRVLHQTVAKAQVGCSVPIANRTQGSMALAA